MVHLHINMHINFNMKLVFQDSWTVNFSTYIMRFLTFENIVAKEEIAPNEQFLVFATMFWRYLHI